MEQTMTPEDLAELAYYHLDLGNDGSWRRFWDRLIDLGGDSEPEPDRRHHWTDAQELGNLAYDACRKCHRLSACPKCSGPADQITTGDNTEFWCSRCQEAWSDNTYGTCYDTCTAMPAKHYAILAQLGTHHDTEKDRLTWESGR